MGRLWGNPLLAGDSTLYGQPATTPVISPAPGSYTGQVFVTITTTVPSGVIHWTGDGSTPTLASPKYTSPIDVAATATVKALVHRPGMALSAVASSAYTISASQNFPVLYARQLNTGSGTTGIANTAWQQSIARYNFWANASYGGFEQNQGITLSAAFSAVKSYALASLGGHVIETGPEQIDQEWFQTLTETGNEDSVKTNALNNNSGNGLPSTVGWALQASGYPSGSKVASDSTKWYANQAVAPYCPAYTINTVGTLTGPSPAFGAVTWSQFTAWRAYQYLIAGQWAAMENGSSFVGNTFAANAHVDFMDGDNWFMRPRADGCWESTSTVFHPTSSSADSNTIGPLVQQGMAQRVAMLKALQPGIKMCCNADYFNYYQSGTTPQVLDPSNKNLWDIVLAEAPIGQSFSKVTYAGTFATFLAALITQEQLCVSGSKPVFLMEGRNASVQWGGVQTSTFTQSDWQSAAYQNGIAALLQWWCGFQPQTGNTVFWFDEWDAGTGTLGWWGQPSGVRNLTPNAQGIYVIQYTNMVAYLYPAGTNDSVTGLTAVTLASAALVGGGGTHITYNGFSDSTVNTGAAFTSLTIQPRSCVFTLR